MGVTNFDTVQATAFIGGMLPMLAGSIGTSSNRGKWLFVNANHSQASSTGDGSDPERPLSTIARALVLANAGDGICILDGAYTAAIDFNKDHLIICGPPGIRAQNTPVSITVTAASAAVTISADNVRFYGIKVIAANGQVGIDVTGNAAEVAYCQVPGPGDIGIQCDNSNNSSIHDCWVHEQDLAGIKIVSSNNTFVIDNMIEATASAMLHGIQLAAYAIGTKVARNVVAGVDQLMTHGIIISSNGTNSTLWDNFVGITNSASNVVHIRNLGGLTNKFIGNKVIELSLQMSAAATNERPFTRANNT